MTGNVLSAFFLIPVFATLAADPPELDRSGAGDLPAAMLEHRNAHFMMEFTPREQIKAHSNTDRTITTFASNVVLAATPAATAKGTGPRHPQNQLRLGSQDLGRNPERSFPFCGAQARRALRLERIGEASSYSLRMAARPWETRLLEQATSNSSKPCTAKVRKNNVTKRISTKPPEAVPKFL
nr:protein IQ-DOMAIN 1 isoform X2 [Ipomoea batatas]